MTLPDRLRLGRAKRGHTQAQAAKRIGVTRSAWGLWEQGACVPATRRLCELAEYLEVEVAELVQGGA